MKYKLIKAISLVLFLCTYYTVGAVVPVEPDDFYIEFDWYQVVSDYIDANCTNVSNFCLYDAGDNYLGTLWNDGGKLSETSFGTSGRIIKLPTGDYIFQWGRNIITSTTKRLNQGTIALFKVDTWVATVFDVSNTNNNQNFPRAISTAISTQFNILYIRIITRWNLSPSFPETNVFYSVDLTNGTISSDCTTGTSCPWYPTVFEDILYENDFNDYQSARLFEVSGSSIVPYVSQAPWTVNFSFTTWGYSFTESGFFFHNFIPSPYWGQLSFEIIAPSWTGSINLTTDWFWPNETDWNGYWFDTVVRVTTFFHEQAWEYQVRPLYTYWGQTVFPFWEDYNTYTISVPEISADFDLQEFLDENSDDIFEFDSNGDWDISIGEFFWWITGVFKYFTESLFNFFGKLKELFNVFGDVFTTEEKGLWTFQFIPSANASALSDAFADLWKDSETENNLSRNLLALAKGFAVFLFMWGALLIFINLSKND